MSRPLPPVTVTPGVPATIYVGTPATVGAVVIANESPYALMASDGSNALWILAQMADQLNTSSSAFGGNITLTVSTYLSNAATAPSFQVYATAYAPGESIPGTYPCALPRMFNLGNTVTTNATTPNSLEQDVLTPVVLSGLTATKDGTTPSRLDVASGVALLRQADQSLGRVAPSATNFSTVQVNSTYYLDLNPDGTWSWNTSHSGQVNYLSIAQVATDSSGTISTVTDERTLTTTLLNASLTPVGIGELLLPGVSNDLAPVADARLLNFPSVNALIYKTAQIGAAQAHAFGVWDGAALAVPFGIGSNSLAAATNITSTGAVARLAGQASAGSFGVPVIVAQAIDTHVTATTQQTILGYSVATTGVYRVSGIIYFSNSAAQTLNATLFWTNPHSGGSSTQSFTTSAGAGASPRVVNQSFDPAFVTSLPLMPLTVQAQSGSTIQCQYQDGGGAPADFVSFLIERLA